MNSSQISGVIVVVLIVSMCSFMFGAIEGEKSGKITLCETQFKGEMHNGKCMFVTRSEITK